MPSPSSARAYRWTSASSAAPATSRPSCRSTGRPPAASRASTSPSMYGAMIVLHSDYCADSFTRDVPRSVHRSPRRLERGWRTMPVHDSLLDLVGDTPLVRLRRLTADLSAAVLVKVEYLNPGGSVKDRAATAMVLAAERDGSLLAGGTIVEASSGNT